MLDLSLALNATRKRLGRRCDEPLVVRVVQPTRAGCAVHGTDPLQPVSLLGVTAPRVGMREANATTVSTTALRRLCEDGRDMNAPRETGGGVTLDTYTYGLLDPRAGVSGENLRLLGATTLGIEVTAPDLARACGLGNVDPQHEGGVGIGTPGTAAIETCLTIEPPGAGATLVTIRPDLDAFGSMALLALRHGGCRPSPAMRTRIERAARADRFDHGPWPGPRPLPATGDDLASVTGQDHALVAVTGAMFDGDLTARERVGLAARWLESGTEPAGYRKRWTAHAVRLLRGVDDGRIIVEPAAEGRIALVTSQLPGTLRLGYCIAPVVIAHDPGRPSTDPPALRRVVVAQYAPGHVELQEVRDALARIEQGWGGSSTLLGSPQGRSCALALPRVIKVVAQHLIT